MFATQRSSSLLQTTLNRGRRHLSSTKTTPIPLTKQHKTYHQRRKTPRYTPSYNPATSDTLEISPGTKGHVKYRLDPGQNLSITVPSIGTCKYDLHWLRDACSCSLCIDPSTTQKTFQTTDISESLGVKAIERTPDGGLKITWENDLPPRIFGEPYGEHVSVYPYELFNLINKRRASKLEGVPRTYEGMIARPWDAKTLALQRVPYEKLMEDDSYLFLMLKFLIRDGIVMIKNTPSNNDSVELIAKRIGNLRDTLYGRTWDVKSIPDAKNVAYTSTHLGLHMDLLYMKDPPHLQLLHCLKNTAKGGTALFSDGFHAANQLSKHDRQTLSRSRAAYHYRNNNEYYYFEHSTLQHAGQIQDKEWKYVNWSPPFQTRYPYLPNPEVPTPTGRPNGFDKSSPGSIGKAKIKCVFEASRNFAKLIESGENLYKYDYEEGDTVIFNNRRVLHGREAFMVEGGERWLRGAYVDEDVFMSRYRVLRGLFEGVDDLEVGGDKGRYEKNVWMSTIDSLY